MNRCILILGEGTTELRVPGDRWEGCGRVLLRRLFGHPPDELLAFDTHTLSNFRRNLELDNELGMRGEREQARIGLKLASMDAAGLVLMRDDDHRERRSAIESGLADARTQGHTVPAVVALAIECVEAWALADAEAWTSVYGVAPTLPGDPEALWGDRRDPASNHPKCVLRRCFEEIDRPPGGNAVARLLEHASLDRIRTRCPVGFGRFVDDLRRAFPPITCVVAASTDRAIGLGGHPPWGFETLRDHVAALRQVACPGDASHRVAVIMGRRAWQKLPPLPASTSRIEVVVTRDPACIPLGGVRSAPSLDRALICATEQPVDRIYVLGGGELYREAIGHFRCTELAYTRVDGEFPGADTVFPEFERDPAWARGPSTSHHDNGFDYRMEQWSRFSS